MKKSYRIPDMHCPNCALTLESLEDDLEGVLSIKASYHKQLLEVEFDEQVLTEQNLLTAIKVLEYTPVAID
jgi:copper chaperone CopZ